MSKPFYAGYVLPYHSILSDKLPQTMARAEADNVQFFTSPSDAFRYIQMEAQEKAVAATATPIGKNLDEYFKMPGVGVLYRVDLSVEQMHALHEPTGPDKFRGVQLTGPLMDVQPLELQFIISEDDFCTKPMELAELDVVREKLSERLEAYELMETILANTLSKDVRRDNSVRTIYNQALYNTCGPTSPMRQGFESPYPQDQKLFDIHKMLWENHAGLQYMEAVGSLHGHYRDIYARHVVNDATPALAAAKAAASVLGKLTEIAEKTADPRMEMILQSQQEKAAAEIEEIELGEEEKVEP